MYTASPGKLLLLCTLLGCCIAQGVHEHEGANTRLAQQALSERPFQHGTGFFPYPSATQDPSPSQPALEDCPAALCFSELADEDQMGQPTAISAASRDRSSAEQQQAARQPAAGAGNHTQQLAHESVVQQAARMQVQLQQHPPLQQQQQQQPQQPEQQPHQEQQQLQSEQQQQALIQPPQTVHQQQQSAAAQPVSGEGLPMADTAASSSVPAPPLPAVTPASTAEPQPVPVRRLLNLADLSDGANVLAANPEAKRPERAIDKDIDSFMKNDCNANKWLIIELSQLGTVETVKLTMKELYSSRVHTFRVFGRSSHPRKDGADYTASLQSSAWQLLGSFAAENKRGTQSFLLPQRSRVRYLLLMFDTHYGSEDMCAMNWIEVLGVSAAQELEEALALHELDTDSDEHELEQQQQQLVQQLVQPGGVSMGQPADSKPGARQQQQEQQTPAAAGQAAEAADPDWVTAIATAAGDAMQHAHQPSAGHDKQQQHMQTERSQQHQQYADAGKSDLLQQEASGDISTPAGAIDNGASQQLASISHRDNSIEGSGSSTDHSTSTATQQAGEGEQPQQRVASGTAPSDSGRQLLQDIPNDVELQQLDPLATAHQPAAGGPALEAVVALGMGSRPVAVEAGMAAASTIPADGSGGQNSGMHADTYLDAARQQVGMSSDAPHIAADILQVDTPGGSTSRVTGSADTYSNGTDSQQRGAASTNATMGVCVTDNTSAIVNNEGPPVSVPGQAGTDAAQQGQHGKRQLQQQQRQQPQQKQNGQQQQQHAVGSVLENRGSTKPKQAGNLFDVIKSELMQLKLDQGKVAKKVEGLGKRSSSVESLTATVLQQQQQLLERLDTMSARLDALAAQQAKVEYTYSSHHHFQPPPGHHSSSSRGHHQPHHAMGMQAGGGPGSHSMPHVSMCQNHMIEVPLLMRPQVQWTVVAVLLGTAMLGLSAVLHQSYLKRVPNILRVVVCALGLLNGILTVLLGVWLLVLHYTDVLVPLHVRHVSLEQRTLVVTTHRMLGNGSSW